MNKYFNVYELSVRCLAQVSNDIQYLKKNEGIITVVLPLLLFIQSKIIIQMNFILI